MAYTDYSQLFSQAEQKYGLRPGTGAALMSLEDASGNPYAKSPAGAQGVLQLMPGTAQDMGVSNPNDPAQNIDGGLHYFANILNGPAHGDYRTAAMGYNAGPNRTSFPQSSQNYADQFMGRLPQQPQSGAPPVAPLPPAYPLNGPNQGQNAPSLGSLANQQPVSLDTSPMAQAPAPQQYGAPSSLGEMAAALPGGVPQHNKFPVGAVLGSIGDALMAYSGMRPSYGPFLQQEKMLQQQQDFERQKFNAELQMRMYSMLHPEAFMQAGLFDHLPKDQQYSVLHYKDLTDPLTVSTPQGTQSVPRTETKQVGNNTYYRLGNDWYQMGAQ